jgi:hypothetical protein
MLSTTGFGQKQNGHIDKRKEEKKAHHGHKSGAGLVRDLLAWRVPCGQVGVPPRAAISRRI